MCHPDAASLQAYKLHTSFNFQTSGFTLTRFIMMVHVGIPRGPSKLLLSMHIVIS